MNEHKTVLGKKNNLYRVCVNHQEIRLYDANVLYPPYGEVKQVPYGIVGISEAVSVTIEASFDVQKVEIQPVSLGFSQIVQNNTVTFCVTKPCSITVHVNDDLQKTLHLFFYDAQERFTYQKENVLYFGKGTHDAGIINMQDDNDQESKGFARKATFKMLYLKTLCCFTKPQQPWMNAVLMWARL